MKNIEGFSEQFCFQMSEEEFIFWRSQNVISKNDRDMIIATVARLCCLTNNNKGEIL